MSRRVCERGRPVACVLGEIDLVRALRLGGISSAVAGTPGEPVRYSRSAVTVLDQIDTWRYPDAAVERLLAFARAQPELPVLYFDGDWDLLLISRHRARLQEAFRFVVADPLLVEDLVDKARFQKLADRLGLPVPRGQRLSIHGDRPADTDLRFPLVAKPLTRLHETWRPVSRAKAMPVDTPAALRTLCAQLASRDFDVFVQEAIPGPESEIESYHVYVDQHGDVAGEFTGRKLRTHPPRYGYSTALTITASEEVMAVGREIVGRLGLHGVAKLDFKRAPDGGLRLLEVNPRFNLWHHPGALAGVNLPALVYCDLVGLPRSTPAGAQAGVRWCSLAHDLQAARAQGMPTAAWLAWTLRCEAKSGFAWDDPLPLPRAALWRLKSRVAAQLAHRRHKRRPSAPRGLGAGGGAA